MRRSTLAICALLTVSTYGCDRVKLAWDKLRGQDSAATAPPRPPVPPTPRAADSAAAAAGAQPAPDPGAGTGESGQGQGVLQDVPYVSDDTGTIAPGMAERDVYSLWGAPAAVRRVGQYTYLFFQNGCEYTCGTMDVVTLFNGQVIDAIVRWDGHRYSGESSSPPGKLPVPNVGGDTLRVPPPVDSLSSGTAAQS